MKTPSENFEVAVPRFSVPDLILARYPDPIAEGCSVVLSCTTAESRLDALLSMSEATIKVLVSVLLGEAKRNKAVDLGKFYLGKNPAFGRFADLVEDLRETLPSSLVPDIGKPLGSSRDQIKIFCRSFSSFYTLVILKSEDEDSWFKSFGKKPPRGGKEEITSKEFFTNLVTLRNLLRHPDTERGPHKVRYKPDSRFFTLFQAQLEVALFSFLAELEFLWTHRVATIKSTVEADGRVKKMVLDASVGKRSRPLTTPFRDDKPKVRVGETWLTRTDGTPYVRFLDPPAIPRPGVDSIPRNPFGGKTIVVASKRRAKKLATFGPDSIVKDLGKAIDESRGNDIIWLAPGEFEVCAKVRHRQLHLRSLVPGEAIVRPANDEHPALCAGFDSEVRLTGIHFQDRNTRVSALVEADRARVIADGCTFSSAKVAIKQTMGRGRSQVRRCTFTENTTAIDLSKQTTLAVGRCTFTGNERGVVVGDTSCSVQIRGNTFEEHRNSALILEQGNAGLVVRDNQFQCGGGVSIQLGTPCSEECTSRLLDQNTFDSPDAIQVIPKPSR